MELGFTWFDFVALAVLALSGIMAFARGLIREVFSVIAFIGAFIAAYFLHNIIRPTVESVTNLEGWIASLASGLLIFLVVFILITLVTSAVAKTAHQSTEIGSFDRAAGLAFGVLRGVLVVALFVLLMRQTTDDGASPQQSMPEAITSARTFPIYESVAIGLEQVLPRVRERTRVIMERREAGESAAPAAATPEAAPPAEPEAAPN